MSTARKLLIPMRMCLNRMTSGCVTWIRRSEIFYSGPRDLRMATARATMGRKVVFHLGSFLKPVARIFFNWPPILRLASK